MTRNLNSMKWYILFVLFILSLIACNKPSNIVNGANTPVFKFNGTIGNDQINYQAGVNRLYMFSNYFKDSQNLWTLEGTFATDSCSTCEPYLSFQVKDVETTNGSTLAKDYAEIFKNLILNSYSIDSILTTTATEVFTFTADESNPIGTQFDWDFGDGIHATNGTVTHIFPVTGERDVQLITTFGNYKDTIVNHIDASFNSTCRVQFTTTGTADSLLCTAPSGFQSYLWMFGNGLSSSVQNPNISFQQPGIYTVQLNATSVGCNSVLGFKRKVAVQQTLGTYCLANYHYQTSQSTTTTFQPRINKNAFVVTYKKNGNTYYSFKPSKSLNQSNVPIFTLHDINLYVPNEKNQSTVWVTGNVDTWLYNYTNPSDSIRMTTNELKFAIAFPR